jgi:hypothetical protein
MEAGREQLFLHVPPAAEIDVAAFAGMLQDLETSLLQERALRFAAHGAHGYLLGEDAVPVASLPPTSIDRSRPGAFLPEFGAPGGRDFYALNSEIEMSLFAHPHNLAREQRGQRPLNALWLWGGGTAACNAPRRLPVIFSDDPLLQGFAACCESPATAWPGNVRSCLEQAGSNFVAAPVFADEQQLQSLFLEIGTLWRERRLANLLVLFDDLAIEQARSWQRFTRFGGRARLEKLLHEPQ